jgi:hypothetical protein
VWQDLGPAPPSLALASLRGMFLHPHALPIGEIIYSFYVELTSILVLATTGAARQSVNKPRQQHGPGNLHAPHVYHYVPRTHWPLRKRLLITIDGPLLPPGQISLHARWLHAECVGSGDEQLQENSKTDTSLGISILLTSVLPTLLLVHPLGNQRRLDEVTFVACTLDKIVLKVLEIELPFLLGSVDHRIRVLRHPSPNMHIFGTRICVVTSIS